jgi:hypothetical protein
MTEPSFAVLNQVSPWWFGGLLLGVIAGFALWRARKQRRRWRYRRQLEFSLTGLRDNCLRIRTLGEVDCQSLFLEMPAVKKLWRRANATTIDNPLPQLDTDDYLVYLRAVGDYLSGWFAQGHLRLDQGLPVHAADYVVGLAFEMGESARSKQLRAIIVSRELLEQLPAQSPIFEHESQRPRWHTLQAMAKAYRENPLRLTVVEVVLPTHASVTGQARCPE